MNKTKIKVAIATGRPGQLINKHAGTARFYKVYEIENHKITGSQLIELSENQILRNVLHTHPIDFTGHPLEDVEIILSGGMGAGGMQKLLSVGKRGYMIGEKRVEEAIEKLLNGTLQALDPHVHHKHHDHGDHGHHH